MTGSAHSTVLVGSGVRARTYARLLRDHPRFSLRGIHTEDETRGRNLAVLSGSDWLADPDLTGIDLVVIASRPDRQADRILQARAAGAHVLAEKPLCLSTDDVDRLTGLDRVHVAHPHRFHTDIRRLRALIPDLGRPLSLRMESLRYRSRERYAHPDRDDPSIFGPGVLWDMGSHLLDLLRFLLPGSATDALSRHRTRDMDLRCSNYSDVSGNWLTTWTGMPHFRLTCDDTFRGRSRLSISIEAEFGNATWNNGRLVKWPGQGPLSRFLHRMRSPRLHAPDADMVEALAEAVDGDPATGLTTLDEAVATTRDLLSIQPVNPETISR